MFAGMKLGVFTPLHGAGMTGEQLARALNVPADRLTRLLYNLVSAGLLTVEDGVFYNTPESNAFLVEGMPDYMGGMYEVYLEMYEAALESAESIRSGKPAMPFDFANMAEEQQARVVLGQHAGALASGRDLHTRFDFSTKQGELLDVGGGSGGVAIGLTQVCPHIRGSVADFPNVLRFAQECIAEAGVADRVRVLECDVVNDTIEDRFEFAAMRAFLQVLSPEDIRAAVTNVTQALKPAGELFVMGWITDDSRITPATPVGMDMVFMNVYEDGRSYTEGECRQWLSDAGLEVLERITLANGWSILRARKL
jgi:SAM-dependent methyltransferase